MAYEQHTDSLYVMFQDNTGSASSPSWTPDNHLYRFVNIVGLKDYEKKVLLYKEIATMKLETFNSVLVGSSETSGYNMAMFIDYEDPPDGSSSSIPSWRFRFYGTKGTGRLLETWTGNPGGGSSDFRQYNVI